MQWEMSHLSVNLFWSHHKVEQLLFFPFCATLRIPTNLINLVRHDNRYTKRYQTKAFGNKNIRPIPESIHGKFICSKYNEIHN